jgi:hypothetical protein
MSDLAARLEALLRIYVAACQGRLDDARSGEAFRKGLQLLMAEYGFDAVDAALDELPDDVMPAVYLHRIHEGHSNKYRFAAVRSNELGKGLL